MKTRTISKGLLLLSVLLVSSLAHAAPAKAPQRSSVQVMRMIKPGSPMAAKIIPKYVRNPAGIFVPNKILTVVDKQGMHDQAYWNGTRRAVLNYLGKNGVKLSPLSYQKLVHNVAKRAEKTFNKLGGSLAASGWKIAAVEGGSADVVNATAWTGGIITINRPLIDLAYQIGRVVDAAGGSQEKIDRSLVDLANFRKGAGPMPTVLGKPLSPEARRVAEGIVSGVVMHEMGHAANGHLEIKESKKLWLPGQVQRGRGGPQQRHKEWQADDFSVQLGARGGTATPYALPYFDRYMFLSRPTTSAKGKYGLVDNSTHPLTYKRHNAMRKTLTKLLPKDRSVAELPKLGPKKLWLPQQTRTLATMGQGLQTNAPAPAGAKSSSLIIMP